MAKTEDRTTIDEAAFGFLKQEAKNLLLNSPKAHLYLVLEGDWGGQIYLTIPWAQVGPNARVATLLRKMDRLAQHSNDGDGARFYLIAINTRLKKKGVGGGMGGGALTDSLRLHKEFVNPEFPPYNRWTELLAKTDWQKVAKRFLDIQSQP